MVHLDAGLTALCVGVEIGEFGGHKVFGALVAAEGYARMILRLALAVDGRRVEIVHAVLNGIIHQLVHFLIQNLHLVH